MNINRNQEEIECMHIGLVTPQYRDRTATYYIVRTASSAQVHTETCNSVLDSYRYTGNRCIDRHIFAKNAQLHTNTVGISITVKNAIANLCVYCN